MNDIVHQDVLSLETKRRGNPAWIKGMKSPNPKGQALGNEYLQTIFKQGFDLDRRKHKDNIIQYAFKQARKDNTVLDALLKKLLPDLVKNEGSDVIITAPPVINFIAVYKGNNADTGEVGYRGSGALPGSIESESKV